MGRKIVFGAYPHWTHFVQTGVHHYAHEFAKDGYEVAFISSMISPFHWFVHKDKSVFSEKKNLWFNGGEWIKNQNIWHYTPYTLLPFYNKPVLRSRWVLENSYRFTLPSINHVLKTNNFKEADIVWIDNVNLSYLLTLVSHKKSVFRIADDYYAEPKGFREKEEELIRRANVTIVPSYLLKLKFNKMIQDKILYLPHGVDFGHFHYGSDNIPKEYHNIPSPRVIYVGTIAGFFDVELVEFAARRLPKVSFILIGKPKYYIDISKISKLANVYFLGSRNYSIIPQYIKNADIGMVPFKRTRYTDPLVPIKLYEYMACGLPVVSMKFKEFNYFKTPAYVSENYNDFLILIKKALSEKNKKEKYIEFAKHNTWKNRYEEIKKELLSAETH